MEEDDDQEEASDEDADVQPFLTKSTVCGRCVSCVLFELVTGRNAEFGFEVAFVIVVVQQVKMLMFYELIY